MRKEWENYARLAQRYKQKEDLKLFENISSDSLVAGLRRSIKLIETDGAAMAYVASDIAPNIYEGFVNLCAQHGVPVTEVPSKSALGKACRIDVDAAVVTIRK